jgi:diaminopimelate decarboxylase
VAGLNARFAMKASPNAAILKIFKEAGMWIDASSGFEVTRALQAGFEPAKISLSTQELPSNFAELSDGGIARAAPSLC